MRTFIPTCLLAGALVLAACGDPSASGSGATVVEPDAEAAATDAEDADDDAAADVTQAAADDDAARTDEPDATEDDGQDDSEAAPDALGTRGAPLELGTVIEMGEWTVAVTEVTPDATDAVMAENQFNDPPVEGRQFVLFRVEATYAGDDSGDPWLDFSWAIVGSVGNTFGGASFDDYCGVIPDALDERGETFPGGSVEGNVCVSAASDQLEGGTILVEETFSFEDTRAFYALP
jgi:hypothetical protein